LEQEGFKLKFFVGMNYISLLKDNEHLLTTTSQIEFQITVSPSVTFAFANEQSFSFVNRLSLQVVDTMYVDTVDLSTRHLQHVTMQVQMPNTYQVDPDGLFPTGTIRFAIAQQLPDADSPLWQNPCATADTMVGFMDPSSAESWNTLYGGDTTLADRYRVSMSQSCAVGKPLCTNPTTLEQGLVEFTFPLGAEAFTAAMLESGEYSIFVTFLLSVVDDSGKKRFADVTAESLLSTSAVSVMCAEDWVGTLTLDKLTEIDMMVGLVQNDSDWNTTISEYRNILDGENRLINLGGQHTSPASSLITLSVKPKIGLEQALGAAHYMTIDSYVSMHFLDEARYLQVYEKFQNPNKPYTERTSGGYTQVAFSEEVTTLCGSGYECGIRYGVGNGKVLQPDAVHSFTNDTSFTTDDAAAADFIQRNLLDTSQFSRELAQGMTSTVQTRKGLDNGMSRAWYINPTFTWKRVDSTQTGAYLTDYMIGVLAISLRDTAGAVVSRRLLSMHNGPTAAEERLQTAVDVLRGAPVVGGAPALKFNSNLTESILSIFMVQPEHGYAFIDLVFHITSSETRKEEVAENLVAHVESQRSKLCAACLHLYPVFTNVVLSDDLVVVPQRYEGVLTMLLVTPDATSRMDQTVLYKSLRQNSTSGYIFASTNTRSTNLGTQTTMVEVEETLSPLIIVVVCVAGQFVVTFIIALIWWKNTDGSRNTPAATSKRVSVNR
jgi:hypothetical protein